MYENLKLDLDLKLLFMVTEAYHVGPGLPYQYIPLLRLHNSDRFKKERLHPRLGSVQS